MQKIKYVFILALTGLFILLGGQSVFAAEPEEFEKRVYNICNDFVTENYNSYDSNSLFVLKQGIEYYNFVAFDKDNLKRVNEYFHSGDYSGELYFKDPKNYPYVSIRIRKKDILNGISTDVILKNAIVKCPEVDLSPLEVYRRKKNESKDKYIYFDNSGFFLKKTLIQEAEILAETIPAEIQKILPVAVVCLTIPVLLGLLKVFQRIL